jgi:hypothetical protein
VFAASKATFAAGVASISIERLLLLEFDVALVPPCMDLTPVDGVLDRATRLVGVGAIGEAAEWDIGAKLDEVALQLAGNHAPELELAEAWSIDHVTPGLHPDQLGGGGGVFAFLGPVGNLSNLEVQAGLDDVQERALAHAALPRDGGDPLGKQAAQAIDPTAVGGRGDDGFVTKLGVQAQHPLEE